MLSVIALNSYKLNVVFLSVIMLNSTALNVSNLSVIIPNDIMPNVVAPTGKIANVFRRSLFRFETF